jgi:hypothetical protein
MIMMMQNTEKCHAVDSHAVVGGWSLVYILCLGPPLLFSIVCM